MKTSQTLLKNQKELEVVYFFWSSTAGRTSSVSPQQSRLSAVGPLQTSLTWAEPTHFARESNLQHQIGVLPALRHSFDLSAQLDMRYPRHIPPPDTLGATQVEAHNKRRKTFRLPCGKVVDEACMLYLVSTIRPSRWDQSSEKHLDFLGRKVVDEVVFVPGAAPTRHLGGDKVRKHLEDCPWAKVVVGIFIPGQGLRAPGCST
ncbi:unnamed protein product [Trichogramma brassicae]|uniref:Uncharacterized protein n=1 Tax=Trichogramma brassicae TaxID=86971 RepID=A0A6H5HSX5_9HYME|nr:unnamed protein product [Trichogramma brassicae]